MKMIRLFTVSMIFAALFAVSAFAQGATGKIGVINTFAFDKNDKNPGIAKYVTALNTLEAKYKTETSQLQAMGVKINNLKKEINTLQNPPNKNVPINRTTITSKAQEHDKLVREYKFKEEDLKARYETDRQKIVGPVYADILKAMQAYAKQKGYVMILDAARLERAGLVLAFDRKHDVTEDFIKFYNARPAGTATK